MEEMTGYNVPRETEDSTKEEIVEAVRLENNQEKKSAPKKESMAEKIKRIKETLSMNPHSIAIAPHTEEGHTLSYMTLWADRLIWALRKKVGIAVDPDKLMEHTKVFQSLIEKLYFVAGNPGTEYTTDFSSDDKFRIARMSRSWIILPKTAEGRMLAFCAKRIDPLIMQMKATENTETLLTKIQGLLSVIVEFNRALESLSDELLKVSPKSEEKLIKYKPSPLVRKILNSNYLKTQVNTGIEERV